MTAPIPYALLTDDLAVKSPKKGGWGGEYGELRLIRCVRFEPERPREIRDESVGDGPKGTVFIDARNSEGAFPVPSGSLVSVSGGEEMTVSHVTELHDLRGIHHWELEVR